MSLVFVAWLEMIDRWLAERWQSQRSQERINSGGVTKETWCEFQYARWNALPVRLPTGIFLRAVDYIAKRYGLLKTIMDIWSHQIGCIHQEVWKCVGQKWEKPGDQGQSQTPAALLSSLSKAEDSGSREGGSPSERGTDSVDSYTFIWSWTRDILLSWKKSPNFSNCQTHTRVELTPERIFFNKYWNYYKKSSGASNCYLLAIAFSCY